jgi:signal transduction histidine kinase
LTIDVARLDSNGARGQTVFIRDELIRLTEDVHALSYRLHPSMLYDLGLVEAIRAECDGFRRSASLAVQIDARDVADNIPHDVSLCLYRIAQEALRNVARHAQANSVNISLCQARGGLELRVSDDGKGFDTEQHNGHASLGHASMRERVQLVRGKLRISSAPGAGSTICAWVPLNGGGL